MRNKLTATRIKNAKDGKHHDGGGLILVVENKSGKWIYRYTRLGRRREMGLGTLHSVTLSDARRARDAWEHILASGEDPIDTRAKNESDARAQTNKTDPTFSEMVAMTFDARKNTLRAAGERGRWLSPIELHITPQIGKKKMSQLICLERPITQ